MVLEIQLYSEINVTVRLMGGGEGGHPPMCGTHQWGPTHQCAPCSYTPIYAIVSASNKLPNCNVTKIVKFIDHDNYTNYISLQIFINIIITVF